MRTSTGHQTGREPTGRTRGTAFEAAREEFLAIHGAFAATAGVDELRRSEYRRLDAEGHVYLDYTGGGQYADWQIREHMRLLRRQVLGNPHSVNPTSSSATRLVERARDAVLAHFGATPDDYAVIFTPNATGALRLVGESYPFRPGDHLLLLFDNHNSVNGIREFARAKGARTVYVPCVAPEIRVDHARLDRCLRELGRGQHGLFGFPAQSNFTGVQHPLDWIEAAHAHGWDVVLDCAAFAPTNRLDLQVCKPDFVPISFYKLFGYPTGVGCLLARKEALERLARPWFSGGTIVAASVQGDWYRGATGHTLFEDGTLNYLNLPAVEIGLKWIEQIGTDVIHTRVKALGSWLLAQLDGLRHADGEPAVKVYGPPTWDQRGGTVALNFLDPRGRVIDERIVDKFAQQHKMSLRTGCFCNPGAGEVAFGLGREDVTPPRVDPSVEMTVDEYVSRMGIPSGGFVRVSLGLPSDFSDVYRFVQFANLFRDLRTAPSDLPPRSAC